MPDLNDVDIQVYDSDNSNEIIMIIGKLNFVIKRIMNWFLFTFNIF